MVHMISVWLPHWSIERLKRATRERSHGGSLDDHPFALIASEEGCTRLTAVNAVAGRETLFAGLSLADARARCPYLRTAPARPERDAATLLQLARWCGRYSPSLNTDGDQGLWIDVTGVTHLFGGANPLALDLEVRLARLGFTAHTGLGPTLGEAWARARFAPLPAETSLAALPIEGLRLSPKTLTLLKRFGLGRIGELERLPRGSLKRRFPSSAAAEAVLARLDQALGRRNELRSPLYPRPRYSARRAFPEPLISSAAVETALEELAQDLAGQLADGFQGARQIVFTLYRIDGTWVKVRAGFSAPCRASSHFSRLLSEKIKDVNAGFGIDCLTLAATALEELLAEQITVGQMPSSLPSERLVDRLTNRLSAAAVFALEPHPSHIPERAQKRRQALTPRARWPAAAAPAPRPPFLLARPEPIAVIAEVPEGPPIHFTWRRLVRWVTRAEGPERIAPEWWREIDKRRGVTYGHDRERKEDSCPRDYYRIEDKAGARYWVFREGFYLAQGEAAPPQWYLHGLFG